MNPQATEVRDDMKKYARALREKLKAEIRLDTLLKNIVIET